jgi:hypothetical protein
MLWLFWYKKKNLHLWYTSYNVDTIPYNVWNLLQNNWWENSGLGTDDTHWFIIWCLGDRYMDFIILYSLPYTCFQLFRLFKQIPGDSERQTWLRTTHLVYWKRLAGKQYRPHCHCFYQYIYEKIFCLRLESNKLLTHPALQETSINNPLTTWHFWVMDEHSWLP